MSYNRTSSCSRSFPGREMGPTCCSDDAQLVESRADFTRPNMRQHLQRMAETCGENKPTRKRSTKSWLVIEAVKTLECSVYDNKRQRSRKVRERGVESSKKLEKGAARGINKARGGVCKRSSKGPSPLPKSELAGKHTAGAGKPCKPQPCQRLSERSTST